MELHDVEPPLASDQRFEGLLGLEFTELSAETVRARVPVREELLQPTGRIHGGVYAAIAESLASRGTADAVIPANQVAVGLSNQTSFLRPLAAGHITSVATRRHRGRTTWVWDVDHLDDAGRRCAVSRVTIAVREG
ncbi:MAG: PaaI family thioesterase [Solirubrobacterales bacterium]|nr:PaaI family thioesterase [Solirubrobacterales bacterium]MBV9716189.1 PaaI family thioesterase [Solirubrobacterales bacterium]